MEMLVITQSTFYSKWKQSFINLLYEFEGKHSNHSVHHTRVLARINNTRRHCVEAKKLFYICPFYYNTQSKDMLLNPTLFRSKITEECISFIHSTVIC